MLLGMTAYERELFAKFADAMAFSDGLSSGLTDGEVYKKVDGFVSVECDHDLIQVYKVISNGQKQYRMQCKKCHDVIGSAIKKTPEVVAAAVPELETRYSQIFEMKQTARKFIIDQWRSRKDSQWWQRYSAYLNSPAWAEKRLKVFKRANWLCEGCGEERATEVHHLTYDHVEHEFLFELVALCHGCHDRITSAQRPGTK